MQPVKQRTRKTNTVSLIEAKTTYAVKAMEFKRRMLEQEKAEREEKKEPITRKYLTNDKLSLIL